MPGISCSAISISRRPQPWAEIFLTQKSELPALLAMVLSLGDTSSSSELEPELKLSWDEAEADRERFFFFLPPTILAGPGDSVREVFSSPTLVPSIMLAPSLVAAAIPLTPSPLRWLRPLVAPLASSPFPLP